MPQTFIHPLADVQSTKIGVNTHIWQFVVVLPDANIGRECNIFSHCIVENDVVIGDGVTVQSGVHLSDGLRVGDDVFIGTNASFANNLFHLGREAPGTLILTKLDAGTRIGAGATILPGITIGRNAIVSAGSVVTRSIPPNAIVEGNPAKIIGYANAGISNVNGALPIDGDVGITKTRVKGVMLHRLPHVPDIRGNLTVGEFCRGIPFSVKRYFIVFDVPSVETRGEHAHRECHQFLICVRGSCAVVADDGTNRQEFLLDRPDIGIHLSPMVWGIQYKYSADAALLVFASHYYDNSDYIRDYSQFADEIISK